MRFSTLLSTLALVGFSQCALAALTPQPVPPQNPLDAAAVRLSADTYAHSEVREVSPSAAEELLKSTAGPNWHVLEVRAPGCIKPTDKAHRKECAEISKQCDNATQLANKFHTEITCSALYHETTVVVTTVPTPNKGPHAIKKHHRGSKHKVAHKASERSPGTKNGKRNNCD
ncbi:tyrosine--tRNA ligase [Novimethylophilus kurashikiensis]|uniref:Tyrosine--tRNA ligase n=1 Tax=Novimethylophilus kurashikiensis TaxID=1825523 RepID=A0A2R5F874_9PROT|nr:hypothetical protein [Novimethylophilus kurashikiensis]GBG14397.1 tyrosine--tRNA ligase [Novimethylophilus kurashikiensis]